MKTIHRDIATAVIFSKDKKILQGMKDPDLGGVYPHCWHIPGGGVEKGEDLKTALIREIKEEVGIDISSYTIKLLDDTGTGVSEKTLPESGERVRAEMHFNVFEVVIDDKNADEIKISLDDDLMKYRWTTIEELATLPLTPPSETLFKKLGWL